MSESQCVWLYLGAGANTQPPRPLRGSIPVLTRDGGRLPRGAVALCVPAVWVAVLPRQGNPLRDEFFPAQQVVFLQQLRRGGVHHDKLEGPVGGPYPGDHLLMALALHALSIDEHQAVAREEPGGGGGSIGLHEPDELPRLALLSVQVEPVAAGLFLQHAQPGSEVWHVVTLLSDGNLSPHYSNHSSHSRTHLTPAARSQLARPPLPLNWVTVKFPPLVLRIHFYHRPLHGTSPTDRLWRNLLFTSSPTAHRSQRRFHRQSHTAACQQVFTIRAGQATARLQRVTALPASYWLSYPNCSLQLGLQVTTGYIVL